MKKECNTCVHNDQCKKTIGIIWGFCNTDYEPQPTPTDNESPDFTDPWTAFFEPD